MKQRVTIISLALTVVLYSLPVITYAQKETESIQQAWFAYFNQSRFSNRWGLWFDGHLRTKEDFVTDLSTTIARAGLTYYVNDNTKLTAGYAYVTHYPLDDQQTVSQ